MENRIKECQLDLFAEIGSPRSLLRGVGPHQCGDHALQPARALVRRDGLRAAQRPATTRARTSCIARATCGTILAKLLKIGALVTVSARRARVAMASACPYAAVFRPADRSAEALPKVGSDVLETSKATHI